MQTITPLDAIQLVGLGVFRAHTVFWPKDVVRRLIPWGLELAHQDLAPEGYHPVTLFFQDMIRAHMTAPTPLPNLTYHEQIVGIPFCNVTTGYPGTGALGPYFYMPNLWLDSFWATLGGKLWWGYEKQVGEMRVSKRKWAVIDPYDKARDLISLEYEPTSEDFVPAHEVENFATYCRPRTGIMVQPLVSMLPAGYPFVPVCSNFDKRWSQAVVRPLKTRVTINQSFIPGLPVGHFPGTDEWQAGIDENLVGGFELKAQWRLTVPYPCNWASPWTERV